MPFPLQPIVDNSFRSCSLSLVTLIRCLCSSITVFTWFLSMSTSGLNCIPLGYDLHLPARRSGFRAKQSTLITIVGTSKDPFRLKSNGVAIRRCQRTTPSIKCAMYSSFDDATNNSSAVFSRINVRDPYKRLGISTEASEDEIQSARNFLIQTYGNHKPSMDAIESAHDKIIMQKFYDRKNPKIDFKKKIKDVKQSQILQAVTSKFRSPSRNVIIKTAIAYIVLGALTVLFPTEEGPTLQVGISMIVTMYFLYDRLKSKLRAFLYGAGSFIVSWLVGTLLMVSVMPPLLKGPRSLEVTTSLISYILLWVSSTYLI